MHTYKIVEKGRPLNEAKKALILIHGRGASAGDILGLAEYFTDDQWYIAAPQATNHSWYPYSFMAPSAQNEPWLSSAIDLLHTLITNTLKEVTSEHLYIMGFSQGACLTSEIAARHAQPFGGIGIFTGGLIGAQPAYERYKGNFKGTRVYLSNGDSDPHVPLSRSEETRKQLEKMGARVEMDIFPNRPHTISLEEINRMASLISEPEA